MCCPFLSRKFGKMSSARLFKLPKHIVFFYLLSPYLPSCMKGTGNIRKKMHFIKMKIKSCARSGAPFTV